LFGSLESAINSLAPDWLRARSACTCLKKHAIKARLRAYAGFLIGLMMEEIGLRRKLKSSR
jgi:hypothetical protein